MMPSLRSQLLFRTTCVIVATFCLAAITLYGLMRSSLLDEFDGALLMESRSLISHVEQSGEHLSVELEDLTVPEFTRPDRPHFFQIWTSDGVSVARSPSLLGRDLDPPGNETGKPAFAFQHLPTGDRGREVRFVFEARLEMPDDGLNPSIDEGRDCGQSPDHIVEKPPAALLEDYPHSDPQQLTIAVARPIQELAAALRTLRWMLLLVTAIAAIASAVLMNGAIRRSLRSLQSLARSIENVGVADLSDRIRLESTPQEVIPVVQRLNELLARLDRAMSREKAFTADIAHELRTPLAGLEASLEVCATRNRDVETYRDVVGKCLLVTQGMHAMVDNLLLLARADGNQLSIRPESTELRSFIDDCWQPFAERASRRGLAVELHVDAIEPVPLDRDKARLIVSNLFDNAVSYANDRGWIRLTVVSSPSTLMIELKNSGCTLSPGEASQVFERFWRGDQARSDTGIHSGLGLSLCRRIVEVLGGTIRVETADGAFSVTVVVPLTGRS